MLEIMAHEMPELIRNPDVHIEVIRWFRGLKAKEIYTVLQGHGRLSRYVAAEVEDAANNGIMLCPEEVAQHIRYRAGNYLDELRDELEECFDV